MKVLTKTFEILKKLKFQNINRIIFLLILVSILEILGVGIIIPLISIILDADFFNKNQFFGFNKIFINHNFSVILFTIIIIIFFILKNLIIILVSFRYYKYVLDVLVKLRTSLYRNYILQDYEKHFHQDHSNIIHKVSNISLNFCSVILMSLLNFITELVIFLSILIFMFYYNFWLTFWLIVIFSIPLFIYVKFISHKLKKAGYERNVGEENIIKSLKSGLENIREIKLFSKEEFYSNIFVSHAKKSSDSNLFFYVAQQFPRSILELFAVLGMCLLILFLTVNGADNIKLLTTLAFFGIAMFRILPSVTKMISCIQNLKYSDRYLDILINEKENLETKEFINFKYTKKKLNFEDSIIFKDVNFYYGKKKNILENINLKINKGDKVAITGQSGSGKSTLMDLMMGLIKSKKGEILVDGLKIDYRYNPSSHNIGYVSQNLFFLNDSIERNIAFGIENTEIDKSRIYKVLKDVDLLDFVNNLKYKEKTNIGEGGLKISGGQRQRIAIARALYLKPKIIFFDEATSALDASTKKKILNCIFNLDKNVTIIFVSHDMEIKDYCNKVFEVKENNLIETIKKSNQN